MAKNAQKEMVGMSKEQVLSCMGEAHQKKFENNIEVWEYSKKEYCAVNIAFNKNRVASVNYRGSTGWLPVKGEKCADAIKNCMRK